MAKKGLIARFFEGPERSETYARSTLPKNRWELGWDIFKTNTGRLLGLNWLTILFLIPVIFLFVMRYLLKTMQTTVYPFSQNLCMGYPFYPATSGLESQLILSINMETIKYIFIGVLIGAVAISGGFYVMRNMVWAEGVMIGSDFWKGVKQNFFVVFGSLALYTVVAGLTIISINIASVAIDTHQGTQWFLVMAQVIGYIVLTFSTIMLLYMITISVTYKLKFTHLIRNSFILTIALLPTNIFFALFSVVWIVLPFMGMSILSIIALVICLIWGISLFMLVWTNYSQWVFDKYINDKVPGAKKNRGIYKEDKTAYSNGEELIIEKSRLTSKPIKPITDYDIELYELPQSFSRKDLEKLEETKEAMRRDSDRYSEEHIHDKDNTEMTFEDLISKDNDTTENQNNESTEDNVD